jgi:hypothetical protein
MAQGTPRRGRGMSQHDGLRADRVQSSGPPEQERDLQAEIEDEMDASGREHFTPREGLVGAHEERRASLAADVGVGQQEPVGRGADVAPTRKAEIREATRHQLEREVGHVAAGEEEGVLRQRRGPYATREALDGIAAEADDLIARSRLNAEGQPPGWPQRTREWVGQHRTGLAIGMGAAALAIGCFTLGRRLQE